MTAPDFDSDSLELNERKTYPPLPRRSFIEWVNQTLRVWQQPCAASQRRRSQIQPAGTAGPPKAKAHHDRSDHGGTKAKTKANSKAHHDRSDHGGTKAKTEANSKAHHDRDDHGGTKAKTEGIEHS